MTLSRIIGWLFGLQRVESIDSVDVALAAEWATVGSGPFWLFLTTAGLLAVSVLFYVKLQDRGSLSARIALGVSRGSLLALLLITLAEPVLRIGTTLVRPPTVFVVFDGTESMAIEDQLPPDVRQKLDQAVRSGDGSKSPSEADEKTATRADYVQRLLDQPENFLTKLDQRGCQVEAFLFDGSTNSQLRRLKLDGGGVQMTRGLAAQLRQTGQVTALGSVASDVGQQYGAGTLAAVVIVSDFAQNAGAAPLSPTGDRGPAVELGVPIYTVGIGAVEAVDASVDLRIEPKIRREMPTVVKVPIRHRGLDGRSATVRVTAYAEDGRTPPIRVGERQVTLRPDSPALDFPFTPKQAGKFRFTAEIEPLEGEIVTQNNTSTREAHIIDDYVRLMYVAYEPSWEWRFVKEVFHRDKTVGMRGFRTYLASSDPRVRQSNSLFLPTLTPQRSDFFANDVIFLDDMPRAALTPRFCDMVREFVGDLGGGLVVIAGPRFGPNELIGTPLADMLPVVLDPEATLQDQNAFRLQQGPNAGDYPFMRLAEQDAENQMAWDNLGDIPWYQPVAQVHERADVLAQHPSDTCRDGRTPQPLIAARRFGEGQVVYLAFNETWRLRRRYGERYYRRFWSPLIDNLGLSHALGDRKRFVLRLDQTTYRVDDTVTVTVQGYDENYEPLTTESLPAAALEAELIAPQASGPGASRSISVPLLREGTFELRLPVFTAGKYTLRVKDPVTGEASVREFEVTGVSAERRVAVRNVALQEQLALATGGRSYDLTSVSRLPDDLPLEPIRETLTRNKPLWTTPLWFILAIGLMLCEWLARKWIRLT